ncbi:cyclin-L1 [Hyalella azteca]|uniref:Cyclin-L1 n=1 Tax=Hyalella azteca TaxID=294128 RepID=A0A8B7NG88_HYAAZ|nr:cyclin-L1 [Hyalella azteca]
MATTKTEAVATMPVQKYGKVVLTLDNVLLPPEKLNPSPSSLDGLDADTEYDLRVLGCEMIQTSGILLRLPQVAMACGQVLFQRLYYAKSLVRYPMEATAMACVALASKIEEAPRKIRDVINVFRHIRQVRNGKTLSPVILDANYITLKNQVIKAERRLLKELGFCCHVKHPHKIIIMYLRLVEADDNRNLAKSSWNYMNDALRTDVFMRYSPEAIASACIWLAARKLRVPLPEQPPWYHIVNVCIEDIQMIAASILKLYTRRKVKLETLESKVEEIRKLQQEARLRNKFLPPNPLQQNTPLQAPTSTFSPGSRTHSPRSAVTSDKNKPISRKYKDHHRSDSETSRSSRSPRSRSDVSPRSHKKPRRSDSRSRSRSHDRHHSRGRSRSRDRHSRHKSRSKSPSPNVTPPLRFIKNKGKGPIVQSVSRSRSRSPIRTYEKYERQDKYSGSSKHDRKDKHDKYLEKTDKYVERYDSYEKNERQLESKYDKMDQYDKHDARYLDKDKYGYEKNSKQSEHYERSDSYIRDHRVSRDEKINLNSKYVADVKDKSGKYLKIDKYDKYEKSEKNDKLEKYEKEDKHKYKASKKKSHESKKSYDNGYEKSHKSKKANRHRSRSRDRRR